mmetsp:Transcript_20919/g.60363  ORF Transcript_20919/g.60363 Transcript_20919/m.60363 type:complete len:215 (-) Transcript_20919:138-782(-)
MVFGFCCVAEPPREDMPKVVSSLSVAAACKTEPPPGTEVEAGNCNFAVLSRANVEDPLGMAVEVVPQVGIAVVLRVDEVGDGPVQRYNEEAQEGQRIRPGDYISSVNGEGKPEAIIKALRSMKNLSVAFRRPRTLTAELRKNGQPLGLNVKHVHLGEALFVEGVSSNGAAAACNADIKPGDRVVSVNGKNVAAEMVAEMKRSDTVLIKISRVGG